MINLLLIFKMMTRVHGTVLNTINLKKYKLNHYFLVNIAERFT